MLQIFSAQGWLQRFKDRHNVVCKKVCGEEAAVNQETTENFFGEILPPILQDYSASNIFNSDETALFWRAMPNHTLSFKGGKCTGRKCSKERLIQGNQ